MQLGRRSSTWVYDIDLASELGLEFGRGLNSTVAGSVRRWAFVFSSARFSGQGAL